MPPADNTTPVSPEPPKKVGFFAKLFGKKPAATPEVPQHESQTPPPQLDDQSLPTTDQTAAPSGEGEQNPPTLDVPPSVEGTPVPENNEVPPTLPTQPPAGEQPSEPSSDDSTPPPAVPPAQ